MYGTYFLKKGAVFLNGSSFHFCGGREVTGGGRVAFKSPEAPGQPLEG